MTSNVLKVDLEDYDVVCVQEPYVWSNVKVGYLPKGVASHFSKTMDSLKRRTGVVVVNKHFPVVELLATRDIVAIKLDISSKQVAVASIHMPPEGSIDTHMNLLQELINKQVGNDIVILGDFNAKSSVWGNPIFKSDVRRDDVLTFCIQNDLMIMNEPINEVTFQSTRGR